MHWCGPGHSSIGGAMLKIFLIGLTLLLTLPALACFRMQGDVAVDGETFKIDQKLEHDKQYTLPMGSFIFNLKLTKFKDSKTKHHVKFSLHEKKGTKLILVTDGEEDLEETKSRELYAKGKEGQPNSIINFKLTNI